MSDWKNEAEAREQIRTLVAEYFNDFKKLCFIGRYCFYIIDLIGKNPVKNMNIENLTFFHLINFIVPWKQWK